MRQDDPKEWAAEDVAAFAEDASSADVEAVVRSLVDRPDDRTIAVLRSFLDTRQAYVEAKPVPSQLAARGLIALGPPGVEVLVGALLDGSVRYRPSVLALLWNVGRGHGLVNVMTPRTGNELLDLSLPPGTEEAAEQALRHVFAQALVDPDVFFVVGRFAQEAAFRAGLPGGLDSYQVDASDLMGLFVEASINLPPAVLREFADLISQSLPEERYQKFLTQHPVILDPLAAEVIPKQRLGLELATDFALRRHDDRWVVVEIERPQDRLFTRKDDFRVRFTHAFGQVLDFQTWVDNNVAYAQKLMPKIAAPRGMLVMGLRSSLSDKQQAKLRRFTDNSNRIEIVTYDDLLERAQALYQSLRHRSDVPPEAIDST